MQFEASCYKILYMVHSCCVDASIQSVSGTNQYSNFGVGLTLTKKDLYIFEVSIPTLTASSCLRGLYKIQSVYLVCI